MWKVTSYGAQAGLAGIFGGCGCKCHGDSELPAVLVQQETGRYPGSWVRFGVFRLSSLSRSTLRGDLPEPRFWTARVNVRLHDLKALPTAGRSGDFAFASPESEASLQGRWVTSTISAVDPSHASASRLPSGEIANRMTLFVEKWVHWRGGAGFP